MSVQLPPNPSLKHLKNQAKALLKAHEAGDAEALQRLKTHLPRLSDASDGDLRSAEISLQDCQHVIAREYGFESWNWLRVVVEVDFELLLRLTDRDIQILQCEVDVREWVISLQSADDDTSNAHACPEGILEKVLGLMSESLRAYIAGRMASQESFSSSQVLEAHRLILKKVDLLAAHGYISWPDGSQPAPASAPIGDISPFLLDLVRRPVEEMSVDDIAELSGRLTTQARRSFTVSLRAIIQETVDPFLREAVQLAVDGAEPAAVRRHLEARLVETKPSAEVEKAYRLIIKGILGMQAGDNPRYLEQKIREAAG